VFDAFALVSMEYQAWISANMELYFPARSTYYVAQLCGLVSANSGLNPCRETKMSQGEEISAVEPDWTREALARPWDPGRQLLRCIRSYQRWRSRGGVLALLPRYYNVLKHRFWSVVSGADIPLNARIEGGLQLLHPNGIVIHPDSRIGPNCIFFQQVTIGTREGSPLVPCIGGDVSLGAGAKVLGGITIGNHARIGANAVVLCDVPDYGVAVGVPARVIERRQP
jgi:serine O-acetyltransferase